MSTKPKDAEEKTQSQKAFDRRNILMAGGSLLALSAALDANAEAQDAQTVKAAGAPSNSEKPNILVIWGDDIGVANISAYSNGLMGYDTPNIDRIGKEGVSILVATRACDGIDRYSAVFDLDAGPVTITLPDAGSGSCRCS